MENSQKIQSFSDLNEDEEQFKLLNKDRQTTNGEDSGIMYQKTEEDDDDHREEQVFSEEGSHEIKTKKRINEQAIAAYNTHFRVDRETKQGELSCVKERGEPTILYVWGKNAHGQLGLGETHKGGMFPQPQKIEMTQQVLKVSCGDKHSAFLTQTKQLYVMGSNELGQLGTYGLNDNRVHQYTYPTLVDKLAAVQVTDVSCGANHTLCIGIEPFMLQNGRKSSVFAWGDNSQGQLGLEFQGNTPVSPIYEPRVVEFETSEADVSGNSRNEPVKIDQISAGTEHSFFLDSQQSLLFGCGQSKSGQLGIGRQRQVASKPRQVHTLARYQVVEVSCGSSHTLAVTYDGSVYATGSNVGGQLGLGHNDSMHEFTKIHGISNVLHVSAGTQSGAVDCDGQLHVWGEGVFGTFLSPLKISYRQDGSEFDQLSIGKGFGVAKNKKGKIYAWGMNDSGQLGSGDLNERSFLNAVTAINYKGVANHVAAGQDFVIALMDEVEAGGTIEVDFDLPIETGSLDKKTVIHTFLTSPADTVRQIVPEPYSNVTSHPQLLMRPHQVYGGSSTSPSNVNSLSGINSQSILGQYSMRNPSSAYTQMQPASNHINGQASEFEQMNSNSDNTARIQEIQQNIVEDEYNNIQKSLKEPTIMLRSGRVPLNDYTQRSSQHENANSNTIPHQICEETDPSSRNQNLNKPQKFHRPVVKEVVNCMHSHPVPYTLGTNTSPSAQFPSQPCSNMQTQSVRNKNSNLNSDRQIRRETFGAETSPTPVFDEIQDDSQQVDAHNSIFTIDTNPQNVQSNIHHESDSHIRNTNVQFSTLQNNRNTSITVSDGIREGTDQQMKYENRYVNQFTEKTQMKVDQSHDTSHQFSNDFNPDPIPLPRSQSPPNRHQRVYSQPLVTTLPVQLKSKSHSRAKWPIRKSEKVKGKKERSKMSNHHPPRPPKHLPISYKDTTLPLTVHDPLNRTGTSIRDGLPSYMRPNSSLLPSFQDNNNQSIEPFYGIRSQSENREEPSDENYASTLSKYNQIHQKKKSQHNLQPKVSSLQGNHANLRNPSKFDQSAVYQSKIHDYPSYDGGIGVFQHGDERRSVIERRSVDERRSENSRHRYSVSDKLENSRAHIYQYDQATNEASADTIPPIHVQISHTKSQDKDRKLRKRYKRLKQDSSKAILEFQAENDILKSQIDEMHNYLQNNDKMGRKSDKRNNSSKLAHQYNGEINVLKEKLMVSEKALHALESENKMLHRQVKERSKQVEQQDCELNQLKSENGQLNERNSMIENQIRGQRSVNVDQEKMCRDLRLNFEERTAHCSQIESQLALMNHAMDDMKDGYLRAQEDSTEKLKENTDMKAVIHQLNSDAKIYETQLENLLKFVDDLEHNNKQLMRFVDQKNYQDATDYKNRVSEVLSKPRVPKQRSVSIRQPQPLEAEKPKVSHTRNPTAMLSSLENPMLQSMTRNRSYSPTKDSQPQKSITPVGLENPAIFTQPSLTPPADKRLTSIYIEGASRYKVRSSQQFQELTPFTAQKSQPSQQRYQEYLKKEEQRDKEARESLSGILSSMHYKRDNQVSDSILQLKAGEVIDRLSKMNRHLPTHSDQQTHITQMDEEYYQGDYEPTEKFQLRTKNNHLRGRSATPLDKYSHAHTPALNFAQRPVNAQRGSNKHSVRARSQDGVSNYSLEDTHQSSNLQFQPIKPIKEHLRASRFEHPKLSDIQAYLEGEPGKRQRLSLERSQSPPRQHQISDYRPAGLDSQPLIATQNNSQQVYTFKGESTEQYSQEETEDLPQVFPYVTQAMMRKELDGINESLASMKRKRCDLEDCIKRYECGY